MRVSRIACVSRLCRTAAAASNSSPQLRVCAEQQYLQRVVKRRKVTAALPHVAKSVREAVKTSLLNHVAGDDSGLWSAGPNGHTPTINGKQEGGEAHGSSLNEPVGWDSVLREQSDLYLESSQTRYWPNLPPGVAENVDPFQLARGELDLLSKSIREDLIGTDHPVLNKAASYFFEATADGGKKVRPLMVFLLSRALADTVGSAAPLDPSSSLLTQPLPWQRQDLPQAQRRLAEIAEMMHTASLFHDDVIDESDTRRGMPAVHKVFGNKMAILAGDYLLARASICLARLRHVHVIETMSTIVEHLVRGEVMQLRGTASQDESRQRVVYYLRKNFYKTASLMAHSCQSAALLAEVNLELVDASYRFGKHVGMAFQLVDDVLDFEGNLVQLGKPSLADLKAGLSTAPVLFASEEFPVLVPLMDRKFGEDGDVEQALEYVFQSQGMERTKHLARLHAEAAMEAVLPLAASPARDALIQLALKVVARTK